MSKPATRVSRLVTILSLIAATSVAGGFRAAPSAAYKEGELSFGGTIDTTFVAGEAREHVFSPKADSAEYAAEFGAKDDGRRHQLSRLDWDIMPCYHTGSSA